MGSIYKSSRTTRIWLVPDFDETQSWLESWLEYDSWRLGVLKGWHRGTCKPDATADALTEPYKRPFVDDWFRESETLNSSSRSWLTTYTTPLNIPFVLGNTYFKRLWIVQEVILSPEIQLHFVQGETPCSCSWNDFILACQRHFETTVLSSSTMFVLHQQRKEKSKYPFGSLLRYYGTCDCADIRDRVFGLLGLTESFGLEVDYELSVTQLFEMVMRYHPAASMQELAEPLIAALELGLSRQSVGRVQVQAKLYGSIDELDGKLVWTAFQTHTLSINSYSDRHIRQGDMLYTLSNNEFESKPLLVALRRDPFEASTFHGVARFSVAGTVIAYNADVERAPPAPAPKTLLLTATAVSFEDLSLPANGRMKVEMSFDDCLYLFNIYKPWPSHIPGTSAKV